MWVEEKGSNTSSMVKSEKLEQTSTNSLFQASERELLRLPPDLYKHGRLIHDFCSSLLLLRWADWRQRDWRQWQWASRQPRLWRMSHRWEDSPWDTPRPWLETSFFTFMGVPCSGATHEHMRWDRDGFVKILRQNLLPDAERNFDTKRADSYQTFGTPFDYKSVMHHAVLKITTHSIC